MRRVHQRAGDVGGSGARRRGFALLTVLLVLLALLVLTVPFLMTARNASQSSARYSDRVQSRLALDSALRQARSELARSHISVDETPYWDDFEEATVRAEFDAEFLDRLDTGGVMWEVVAEDLSGRIDLNSAGPQLCANVIGGATRLTAPVKKSADSLAVSSTYGFPELGFLWVGRELIGYTALTPRSFDGLQRGLLGVEGRECGPLLAHDHAAGEVVLDERAFGPARWRSLVAGGDPRRFEAPEHLAAAAEVMLTPFEQADLDAFARSSTPYGDLRGGRRWQRAVRLSNDLQAGESCYLRVDEGRWFNPGTLIQIRGGGVSELALVQSATNGLLLMDAVVNDYVGYETEVRALARRPVNINVADVDTLRLLLQNLQQVFVNERVTRGEATALAELIAESRPFTGHEDFLRRVLLPASGMEDLPADASVIPAALAGGGTLIDANDAVAIYANALNANDSALLFSTLPFCFSSREVFNLEARASVNAPSGIERVSRVREQSELLVPQEPLLQTWASQAEFDEALRLDREAPWWASGPESTSQYDAGTVPPSRLWTELGTWEGRVFVSGVSAVPEDRDSEEPPQPEHTFPSRDEQGYARLWPARVAESGLRQGRVLHFDHETRDPEGRFIPDQSEQLLAAGPRVRWADPADDLLRSLSFSLWVKPQTLAPGVLLDVGQSSLETDRVTLAIEDEDLVLRVLDGPGDHPDTTEIEEGVLRFPLAAGEGPGLAADTWSHIEIDVTGNRPDQMTLMVDGRAFGVERPGLSALASGITATTAQIELEDGEGFPDRGVVRIGRELIEYVKSGTDTLDATHQLGGNANAGFGGRFARPPFIDGQPPLATYVAEVDGQHAAGTPVEVMGYSIPLATSVPSTGGALADDIGNFAVARVTGIAGSPTATGFPVWEETIGNLGNGLAADSPLTGLQLIPVDGDDTVISTEDMMASFSLSGGYAALVQWTPSALTGAALLGSPTVQAGQYRGPNSEPMFGVEIIRYTGRNGGTLLVDQTGRSALEGLAAANEPRAFVVNWNGGWAVSGIPSSPGNSRFRRGLFVVPLSIPASGFTLPALASGATPRSEFAQLTHTGSEYPLTEWVRFDSVHNGHLVRNSRGGLIALTIQLTDTVSGATMIFTTPGPGGGGGIDPGGGVQPADSPAPLVSASPPAPASSVAQLSGTPELWSPYTGINSAEFERWPISRAANSALQFRGVCGTSVNPHPAATPVLPVWRVDTGLSIDPDDLPTGTGTPASLGAWERDWDSGWPGQNDAIFIVDEDLSDPGFPATIHRAWQPLTNLEYDWIISQSTGEPELVDLAGVVVAEDFQLIDPPYTLVALTEPFAVLVPVSQIMQDWATADSEPDTRVLSRIVKFPSGERPRRVQQVVVGGDLRGGELPAVTVDEVLFGDARLGAGASFGVAGGQLVLTALQSDSAQDLFVRTDTMRTARGKQAMTANFLEELPEDAGLLRLGEELMCYSAVDTSTGELTIAEGGRGLLGTEAVPHEAGSTAQLLEGYIVSTLIADLGAGDAALQLGDVDGFPSQGTVLIGTELIHYTRIRGAALEMPRSSTEPGELDGRGDGLFRGRFGTLAAAHATGTPVILFPFRYWDREADRADGPELAYLGFALDQPNAYVRSMFWQAEELEGSQLYVLQRASSAHGPVPAWDAEPDGLGLWSFELGMPTPEGNPVGVQADLMEWRIFARYLPGAFDELDGLSHGWKGTPRLDLFGVDYLAPNQVLRRVER